MQDSGRWKQSGPAESPSGRIRFTPAHSHRRVVAVRLLREIVLRVSVGAGAAAHADFAELAAAALAFQVRFVPQVAEDRTPPPDLRQRRLFYIAGADREVTAREDFARVRDEAHGLPRQTALG